MAGKKLQRSKQQFLTSFMALTGPGVHSSTESSTAPKWLTSIPSIDSPGAASGTLAGVSCWGVEGMADRAANNGQKVRKKEPLQMTVVE